MSRNLDETINADQTMAYQQDEVVWVKLGTCWWPAEVQLPEHLPKEIVTSLSKKIPFAVVKFFDEDKYEFVRNSNNITTYMCDRKNDFIRRGLDMHRSKNMHMNKFPADVSMAELRTGGDPDIITSDQFLPGNKKSPPTPKVVLFPSSSTKKSAKKRPKKKSDGLSSTKIMKARLFSNEYVCELCDYQTDRLNSIVAHQRYHYTSLGDVESVAKLKTEVAKKRSKLKPLSIVSKVSKTSIDDDSFIETKNESHKRSLDVAEPNTAKKIKSSTRSSKKPVIEPRGPTVEDLVREWDIDESMQVDEDEEDLKIENEFESEIVTDVKDDEAADSGVSTEEVHVERKLRDFSELMDDEDDDENVDQNVLDKFDKLMDETAVKLPPVLTGNQKYLKRTRQRIRTRSRSRSQMRSNQEPEVNMIQESENLIVKTESQLKVDTKSEVSEEAKKEFELEPEMESIPKPEPEPIEELESVQVDNSKFSKPSTSESMLIDPELEESQSVVIKPKLRTSKRPLKLDDVSKSISDEKDNSVKIVTNEPRLRTSRRGNEQVSETVSPSNKSDQTLSTNDNNVVIFEAPRLRSSKRLSSFLIENDAKKQNQNQETNAFIAANSSTSVEEPITPKLRTSKRIRKAEDVSTNVLPESDPLEVESNVDVETIPQLRISKRNSKKSTIKAVEQPIIHAATHFEPKEQSTQQFDETLAIDQEITENRTPAPEFINARLRSGKRRNNTAVKKSPVDDVQTSVEPMKVSKSQPEGELETDESLSISSNTLDLNKVTTRSAKKLESNKDVIQQVKDLKSADNAIELQTEDSPAPSTPVLESYKVSTRSVKKSKVKAKEQSDVTEETSLEPKDDAKSQLDDTDKKVELESKQSVTCELAQNKADEPGVKADEDIVSLELKEGTEILVADDMKIFEKRDEFEANESRKTPTPIFDSNTEKIVLEEENVEQSQSNNLKPEIRDEFKRESEEKENCCENGNSKPEKIDLDQVYDTESPVHQLKSDEIEPDDKTTSIDQVEESATDHVLVPESITTELISGPELEQKSTEIEMRTETATVTATAVVEQVLVPESITTELISVPELEQKSTEIEMQTETATAMATATAVVEQVTNEIVSKTRVQLPPPLTPFSKETDQSEVVNELPILEREPSLTVEVSKSPPLPLPLSLSPVDSTMLSEIAATTSSTQEEEIVQSVITTPPLPLEDADQVSEEKPKIVIDKVITASGNIVDAKSYDFNSSANDSQMLDINSMPLVVSDLNTSNCATGSSTTIISVPIANTLASSSSNLRLPSTSSSSAHSTPITYTTVVATNAKNVFSSRIPVYGHKTVAGQRTPKIYKDVSNKTVLLTQSGKPGQFVIVPSTTATSTGSKYTVGKNRPVHQKAIATNSSVMLVKTSPAPRQIMMKATSNMTTPTIITEDGKIVSLQNATVQSAASICSGQKAILMHNQVLCKGQSNSVVVQTLPKKQIVKQVTMIKKTNIPGTFKLQSHPEQLQIRQPQRIVSNAETTVSHATVTVGNRNSSTGKGDQVQNNQTLRYVINDYLGNKIVLHEGQIIAYPYEVKPDEVPAFYIFKVENCNLVPLPDDVMKSMEEYIKKTVPGRILSSNQIVKMPTVIQEIVPSDEKPEGHQAQIPCNGQQINIDERVLVTDDGKKLIYTEHGYIEATDDMDIDEFLLRTKDNVQTAAVAAQIPVPVPVTLPVVEEEEIIFDDNQFLVMNRNHTDNVDYQQVPPKDIIAVALAGSEICSPTAVSSNSSEQHIDTTSTSLTITGPIMATEETKSSSTNFRTLDNHENNVNSAAESMLAMSMPLLTEEKLDLLENNSAVNL